MDTYEYVKDLCERAAAARGTLAVSSTAERNSALLAIAEALIRECDKIIAENEKDIALAGENGVPGPMIDRLTLNEKRIHGIADSLKEVVMLSDPIGKGTVSVRPNGLKIMKVRVPLGTVGMIYEARPNVTVDAAALCLKSGNAVVLRGGKEAINTNLALVSLMRTALSGTGISPDVLQLIGDTSRKGSEALMNMRGFIDVLIPRGGKGLIRAVVDNASVPVIETGAGNCHIYIDSSADLEKALKVAVNAKVSRPAVCNAVETMLVHSDVYKSFLPAFYQATREYGLEIRGCDRARAVLSGIKEATDEDYATEFDDYILAVKVVDSLDEAIEHIKKYTTGHSEAIMTEDIGKAHKFCSSIDCAAVYVNASTRFTDGGEFGLGAEIGISTQKLHTRGPMGLDDLTTVKYIVEGDGQIR